MQKRRAIIVSVIISYCLYLTAGQLSAQSVSKQALDHSVYTMWNTLGGYAITKDGKYASCYKTRTENDGSFIIINLKTGISTEIERGTKSKFSNNDKYAIFTIRPTYAQLKNAKLKKAAEDKKPKDTLAIMELASGKIVKIPNLKEIVMPKEDGNYIAFKVSIEEPDTSKSTKSKKADESLIIYNLDKNVPIDTLKDVESFLFDSKGNSLICVTKGEKAIKEIDPAKKKFPKQIIVYSLKDKSYKTIFECNKKAQVLKPVISDNDKMLAFYANPDTAKKIDNNVEIYIYNIGSEKAIKAIDNNIKGLPEGILISRNRMLTFSKNNNKLFFGIAKPTPEKDTTINQDDIAKLDVWHYNDKYLAPAQLKRKDIMLKRNYLSYIDIDTLKGMPKEDKMIRLATEQYPNVKVPDKYESDWGYAWSSENYAVQSQWNSNPIGDLYIISMKDGSAELLKQGIYAYGMQASPKGNYLLWYDPQEKNYFSIDMNSEKKETINMTKDIPYPLWDELNDIARMAVPYGGEGFNDNENTLYIYDKYDIWEVDPKGERAPSMLTNGEGRANGYTFKILHPDALQLPNMGPGIEEESPIKENDDIYFTVFDNKTKGYGYYMRENKKGKLLPMKKLIMEPDFSLAYPIKAKNANVITYVKSNFSESPNLWVTKDLFKTSKKLTDANPQQANYNWGTCELVNWQSKNGIDLEGLLYKPENFDSSQKYPMIIYFYERNSDNKNAYRKPAVSKSTINVSYFVSNGYLVFIPDIAYTVGHPGQSAMNCIIPGVEKLCENNWVDKDNMAIQGQSWGGYQVAYMVTQTDMFKCAGAGAPVSNMTSAYGGIRWGTGVVRQFQYEHTQSRIGKTPWDEGGLDLYIENSPLFYADKVTTPLLIMHNDNDEAVPWYQGIEYFTALRRLGKQVWMLQYNNETHNLSKYPDQLDYTKRLSQFMDHFLKKAPMPVWMKYGIPATEKGINMGLDLVEE